MPKRQSRTGSDIYGVSIASGFFFVGAAGAPVFASSPCSSWRENVIDICYHYDAETKYAVIIRAIIWFSTYS